jgi:hypothetical protein
MTNDTVIDLEAEYKEYGNAESVLEKINETRLELDSLEQYIIDNEDEIIAE